MRSPLTPMVCRTSRGTWTVNRTHSSESDRGPHVDQSQPWSGQPHVFAELRRGTKVDCADASKQRGPNPKVPTLFRVSATRVL